MSMRTLAFVGSLTRDTPFFDPARGDGIRVFALDEATGALDLLSVTGGADNPTYLAVDAARRLVYAASEVYEWHEGVVTSYSVDVASGGLTYGNKQPTLGHLSAFVSLDRAGRNLLVSNYSMQAPETRPGRSLVVLPVIDGSISPASDSAMRAGTLGPIADRQERTHAHCLVEAPDGRLVAADLGTDEVLFHDFDPAAGRIGREPAERVGLPPGSGPRHVAFSSDGHRLYVLNELASTVAILVRSGAAAPFRLDQVVSTLPAGAAGSGNRAAGIVLSPDGRLLFASNRGHDSIMAYRVDGADGRLDPVGTHPSGGRTPRSFAVDPSGRFLVVANQDGHNLTALRIDAATGALSGAGVVAMNSPMCVMIARMTSG
jgi:6-phosphogluconolactonase